ncbi:dipeptidase [Deinococcus yavapaiensis]|uniref:Membrane dipeptidase n=1 Tax=Deinococcus yavapaiensis KR-236 TaxID=694435 RepID=A0A318SPZ4_9DEIO|nr:membrane dipeptidase [Deinococcus yavapaiensis]PYE54903.1 membrane dipeptidase [Deinococcus yavapaiensis KR-236]
MIVDAHLDLAYLATTGRDLRLSLQELRERLPSGDVPTVTFSSLRRGEVGLCFATLFAEPGSEEAPSGYADQRDARRRLDAQLETYLRWQDDGHVLLLRTWGEIEAHVRAWTPEKSPLGVVLLIENAEPLRDADDLPRLVDAGVRLVGPAWVKANRFCGGNGEPGGLTDRGRDLLAAMRELGVTLDVSHLPEEAFWEAVELQPKAVATHSNVRSLVGSERHLTAEQLRAIRDRDGHVGCVLFNKFLRRGWDRGMDRPVLKVVGDMFAALAEEVGWERVGIGSDLDGGFGRFELPSGLESAADLPRLADVLPEEQREGVLSGHWLRWLERHL